MAVYTDNFDGYTPGGLSGQGNWVSALEDMLMTVVSGNGYVYYSPIDANHAVVKRSESIGNDQYSQIQIRSLLWRHYIGVAVRIQNTAEAEHYSLLLSTNSRILITYTTGDTITTLASANISSIVAGDIFKLAVVGTTLTAYKNGVPVLTVDDATLASGAVGITYYIAESPTSSASLDNWEGGEYVNVQGILAGISTSSTVAGVLTNGVSVDIYNLKYTGSFYNVHHTLVEVEIYRYSWVGSPTTVKIKSLNIRKNYQDRTTPIIGTGVTLTIVNPDAFDAFEDLLVSQEKEFLCVIKYNGTTVFSGYSLCDIYESEFIPKAQITIQFVDYLKRLDYVTVEDIAFPITPIINVKELFLWCLDYININEVNIYIHSSLLEENMVPGEEQCFDRLHIEEEIFKDTTEKYNSMYALINKILLPLGFHFYQYGSAWVFERVDDISSDEDWYLYNSSGTWTPVASLTNRINKQDGDFDYVGTSQKLEYSSGTKILYLGIEDKRKLSLVLNNFTADMSVQETPANMFFNTWYRGSDTSAVQVSTLLNNKINTYVKWEAANTYLSTFRSDFETYVDSLFSPINYNTNDNDVSKLYYEFMKQNPFDITNNGLFYKFMVYAVPLQILIPNIATPPVLKIEILHIKFKVAPIYTSSSDPILVGGSYLLSRYISFIVSYQIQAVSNANGHAGDYLATEIELEQEVGVWSSAPFSFTAEFDGGRRSSELAGVSVFEISKDINLTSNQLLANYANQDFVIKICSIAYVYRDSLGNYIYTFAEGNAVGDFQVTSESINPDNEFKYVINDNFIKTEEVKFPIIDLVDLNFCNGFSIQDGIDSYIKTEHWVDTNSIIIASEPVGILLLDMFARSWYAKYSKTNRTINAKIITDLILKLFTILTDDNLMEDSVTNTQFIIVDMNWDLVNGTYDIIAEEYPEIEVNILDGA